MTSDVIELGPFWLQAVPVFFQTAAVPMGVPHQLPVPPIGSVPIRLNKACRISESQMPHALGTIHLVSDVDSVTATILVIGLALPER